MLLVVVCVLSDDARNKHRPAPRGLASLVLFVTLLGISASFGMQTGARFFVFNDPPISLKALLTNRAIGFAINPARDLGPRLLTAMVGYGAPGELSSQRAGP